MHKFTAIFLTIIFALLLSGMALAGVKKTRAKTQFDATKIQVQKFNADSLNKYKHDKDFNYNGAAEDAGQPSLWARFWNWLWNTLFGWVGRIPYGGPILKYLLLALAAGLLIYVIFKSLDIDPIKLFRGESKNINIPYSESLENIHEINFDDEIEKAISQHNYRLAVRLLYLKCLKQLSDNNLIQWQIDKTNTAYLYEIADPVQKQTFGLLTRQFEYAWYGNFTIDKQAFGSIDQLFKNFKNQLP